MYVCMYVYVCIVVFAVNPYFMFICLLVGVFVCLLVGVFVCLFG